MRALEVEFVEHSPEPVFDDFVCGVGTAVGVEKEKTLWVFLPIGCEIVSKLLGELFRHRNRRPTRQALGGLDFPVSSGPTNLNHTPFEIDVPFLQMTCRNRKHTFASPVIPIDYGGGRHCTGFRNNPCSTSTGGLRWCVACSYA